MVTEVELKLCPFLGCLSDNREVTLRAEHYPLGAGTKPPLRAVVSDCRVGLVAGPWSQRHFKGRSRTSRLGWTHECKNYWPKGLRHRCGKIN